MEISRWNGDTASCRHSKKCVRIQQQAGAEPYSRARDGIGERAFWGDAAIAPCDISDHDSFLPVESPFTGLVPVLPVLCPPTTLSVTINVPVRAPLTVGSKVTEILQFVSKGCRTVVALREVSSICRDGLISQNDWWVRSGTPRSRLPVTPAAVHAEYAFSI